MSLDEYLKSLYFINDYVITTLSLSNGKRDKVILWVNESKYIMYLLNDEPIDKKISREYSKSCEIYFQ